MFLFKISIFISTFAKLQSDNGKSLLYNYISLTIMNLIYYLDNNINLFFIIDNEQLYVRSIYFFM